MDHSDLTERLEKAESGSAELDYLLEQEVGDWTNLGGGWSRHKVTGEERRYFGTAASYTTSLDAIVALIGEKSPLRGPIALEMAGSGFCAIESTEPCQDPVTAWGNTPALAACIALLRALQTKESGHG